MKTTLPLIAAGALCMSMVTSSAWSSERTTSERGWDYYDGFPVPLEMVVLPFSAVEGGGVADTSPTEPAVPFVESFEQDYFYGRAAGQHGWLGFSGGKHGGSQIESTGIPGFGAYSIVLNADDSGNISRGASTQIITPDFGLVSGLLEFDLRVSDADSEFIFAVYNLNAVVLEPPLPTDPENCPGRRLGYYPVAMLHLRSDGAFRALRAIDPAQCQATLAVTFNPTGFQWEPGVTYRLGIEVVEDDPNRTVNIYIDGKLIHATRDVAADCTSGGAANPGMNIFVGFSDDRTDYTTASLDNFGPVCDADLRCSQNCAADLNFSGGVNVDDLLLLIGAWGPVPACAEPPKGAGITDGHLADLAPPGGNGSVNVDDLLDLIGQWGPCESEGNLLGACCLADGNCNDSVSLSDCHALAGARWQGCGSTCAGVGTCPARPINDDCSNAIVVSPNNSHTYTNNKLATTDGPAGVTGDECEQHMGGDIWYRVTADCEGAFEIETDHPEFPPEEPDGSNPCYDFDEEDSFGNEPLRNTILAAYYLGNTGGTIGDCDDLGTPAAPPFSPYNIGQLAACNDDENQQGLHPRRYSRILVECKVGDVFLIRLSGYRGGGLTPGGAVYLDVNCTNNDPCYAPISLNVCPEGGGAGTCSGNWHQSNTDGATQDTGPGCLGDCDDGVLPEPGCETIEDPCTINAGTGVWYKVRGNGETYTASLCTQPAVKPEPDLKWNTKISVYCGTNSKLHLCNDSTRSRLFCAAGRNTDCCLFFQEEVSWCTIDGQDYLILVHSDSGGGDFRIDMTTDETQCGLENAPLCGPPNDECEGARVVVTGKNFDNTNGSTRSPRGPIPCAGSHGGPDQGDLWFIYTADCNGPGVVDTCQTTEDGSLVNDTVLEMFGAGVNCAQINGGATEDVCDEDLCASEPLGQFNSRIFYEFIDGQTYIIRIGIFDNPDTGRADGPITINIECTPGNTVGQCCPPAGGPGSCTNITLDSCRSVCGNEWTSGTCPIGGNCTARSAHATTGSQCVLNDPTNPINSGNGPPDLQNGITAINYNDGEHGIMEDFFMCNGVVLQQGFVKFLERHTAPGVGTPSAVTELRVRIYDLNNGDMLGLKPGWPSFDSTATPYIFQHDFDSNLDAIKTLGAVCGTTAAQDNECWQLLFNAAPANTWIDPCYAGGALPSGEYAFWVSVPHPHAIFPDPAPESAQEMYWLTSTDDGDNANRSSPSPSHIFGCAPNLITHQGDPKCNNFKVIFPPTSGNTKLYFHLSFCMEGTTYVDPNDPGCVP